MATEKLRPALGSAAGLVAVALLLAPGSPGCGGEAEEAPALTKKAMAITDLPRPVDLAAKKALRGMKVSEAWRDVDRSGKLEGYEVRARSSRDGKIRDLRITPEGKVVGAE